MCLQYNPPDLSNDTQKCCVPINTSFITKQGRHSHSKLISGHKYLNQTVKGRYSDVETRTTQV